MSAAAVSLRGATWGPGGTPILDRFDLEVASGTITALLGPSGCGKSSLLRVIAGLRPLSAGTVERAAARVSFVFQDPSLLPWRTVRQNVALPAEFGPVGGVDAAIAAVGLAAHADKLPAALSGGQRMRASLARALVSRPDLLLLDEPFAALDHATRAEMQALVLQAHAETGCTVVLVTHDVPDAARLADRVLLVEGPPLRVRRDLAVAAPRPRSAPELAAVFAAVEAE